MNPRLGQRHISLLRWRPAMRERILRISGGTKDSGCLITCGCFCVLRTSWEKAVGKRISCARDIVAAI